MKVVLSNIKDNYMVLNANETILTNSSPSDTGLGYDSANGIRERMERRSLHLDIIVDIEDEATYDRIKGLFKSPEKAKASIMGYSFKDGSKGTLTVQGKVMKCMLMDGHILIAMDSINYIKTDMCTYRRTFDHENGRWNDWERLKNWETKNSFIMPRDIFDNA